MLIIIVNNNRKICSWLFVLQVIVLQLTRCQGGGGGGGPSTFGYDASSACSKPYSRAGRAHHEDLPCDFRKQNWCTIAGSSYPWYFVSFCASSSSAINFSSETFARPTFVRSRARGARFVIRGESFGVVNRPSKPVKVDQRFLDKHLKFENSDVDARPNTVEKILRIGINYCTY